MICSRCGKLFKPGEQVVQVYGVIGDPVATYINSVAYDFAHHVCPEEPSEVEEVTVKLFSGRDLVDEHVVERRTVVNGVTWVGRGGFWWDEKGKRQALCSICHQIIKDTETFYAGSSNALFHEGIILGPDRGVKCNVRS